MSARLPVPLVLVICAALLTVMAPAIPCVAADRPATVTVKVAPPPTEKNDQTLENASSTQTAESAALPSKNSQDAQHSDTANLLSKKQNELESSFSWGGYFKAIGMLFIILAALWYIVWHLKRKGAIPGVSQGTLPKGALRIEGSLPIGPRKGLFVVRFLNHRLLLGVTDHQITLITELDDHEANDAEQQRTDAKTSGNNGQRRNIDFEAIMRALRTKKNTPEE